MLQVRHIKFDCGVFGELTFLCGYEVQFRRVPGGKEFPVAGLAFLKFPRRDATKNAAYWENIRGKQLSDEIEHDNLLLDEYLRSSDVSAICEAIITERLIDGSLPLPDENKAKQKAKPKRKTKEA